MKKAINDILAKKEYSRGDIVSLLRLREPRDIEQLRSAAENTLLKHCGKKVYFRGLIEFSNHCVCDCNYCGIRKSNHGVRRFLLTKDEILESALFCAAQGYGSVVLQSGERRDEEFISFVEDTVRSIKRETKSPDSPHGVGITLCVGEQSEKTYRRFFEAGAHRYLLRIESSTPCLFECIHPKTQQLQSRIECLKLLKQIGFQVGTGVMIGLPTQTLEELADDILFFKAMDVAMIGMGPYIVHEATPMAVYKDETAGRRDEIMQLSLNMIAVTRLVLQNVNIAATTALQAMDPVGREKGLLFGANILMPQSTPTTVRNDYLLYEGKPCLDESALQCKNCLERRIASIGREIGYNSWGDSLHFTQPIP